MLEKVKQQNRKIQNPEIKEECKKTIAKRSEFIFNGYILGGGYFYRPHRCDKSKKLFLRFTKNK